MKKKVFVFATSLLILVLTIAGCSGGGATGTLEFYANGEDFVRQGFISKDGWSIQFDHLYITLSDIIAYQTEPPYDPTSEPDIDSKFSVGLNKIYTIDLAEGGEDAPPILVGKILDASAGHYNAISWKIAKAESGPAAGHFLVMVGTAEKDGQRVDFNIVVDQECEYYCGEFVGDMRKGILKDGATADLEMTFHFDHIFGDGDLPQDDPLNAAAVGFEPFAEGAAGDTIINMIEMHLGHVGEGHCHCDCH